MNEFKFSDLYIDLEQSFEVEIDDDKFEKFLQITSDISPLHTDQNYALSRGFKDNVVYGMLTSAFYSTLVGVFLPGKHALLQGIDIQFSKPVYRGDRLTIYGKVSYLNEAYKQMEVKAYIINQASKKISKATIKIGINE